MVLLTWMWIPVDVPGWFLSSELGSIIDGGK
jgi:hypothetical protein